MDSARISKLNKDVKIKSWMNSLRFLRPTQLEIHGQWWSTNYKLQRILIKKKNIHNWSNLPPPPPPTTLKTKRNIRDFDIYFEIKKQFNS